MAGLKILKNRLKSVKSTQKITKAMHVVSAAKLKKFKDKLEDLSDNHTELQELIKDFRLSDEYENISAQEKNFLTLNGKNCQLLIICGSDKGLCGSFNSVIIKQVKNDIKQLKENNIEFKLIIIGKRVREILKNLYGQNIIKSFNIGQNNFEVISNKVKEEIKELTISGEVNSCKIYYNKFVNALTQNFHCETILPIKNSEKSVSEYEYEGYNIFMNLIDLYLNSNIIYMISQSKASEEGARMTAMDNATRNAGELIDKLTLKLNRSRQAIITTELIEIISGAGAL